MSESQITIPADLWGQDENVPRDLLPWTPASLRASALAAENSITKLPLTALLLRRLADEIERQAPRKVGWYSVRYETSGERSLYYWNGVRWQYDGRDSDTVNVGTRAIIEGPVTFRAES